jgi:hypothetical protein
MTANDTVCLSQKIDDSEVLFVKENNVDSVGILFFWRNRLFRGIFPTATAQVRQLLSCGLIDELVSENLFPGTWLTSFQMDRFDLIVEHEIIHTVTYPFEWSFTMLMDAALTVLKVNEIASSYGWQTKDCHGFNILFDSNIPKFIDLGSFVALEQSIGWAAYDQFLEYYYYPLKIWSNGNYYLGRYCLMMAMRHESYLLYRYPFASIIGLKALKRIQRVLSLWNRIRFATPAKHENKLPWFAVVVLTLLTRSDANIFTALARKIRSVKCKADISEWGDYQNRYLEKVAGTPVNSRFTRIVALMENLDIESVVDLGCNQGVFAQMISERMKLKTIFCADYDVIAIDKLYNRLKSVANCVIIPVLLDFTLNIKRVSTRDVSQRLRADAAVALALTHHLLLTQSMSISAVLERIGGFSKKYVLVEFMPCGLMGPDGTAPEIPSWYSTKWFRENFSAHFELIHEESLEKNRILFIGCHKILQGKC